MTELIPLTRGLFAIVDDEDLERLSRHRWQAKIDPNGRAYAHRLVRMDGRRVTLQMHREVMGYGPLDPCVDHIDGDGLNNQRANLRPATHAENMRHRTRNNRNNTSGFRGVDWRKDVRKWRAEIVVNGVRHRLGLHSSAEAAALAYEAAARELHGEFASHISQSDEQPLRHVSHPQPRS